MKLDDKVYDVLKWVVMIVLPAAAVLVNALAEAWNITCAPQVTVTILAVDTFLGALIGVSTVSYNYISDKEEDSNE